MLEKLYLKNVALAKEINVEFRNGLNVLTGESGSGKTIIVQSLELLTGKRAQSEIIRQGESKAIIEAEFRNNGYIKELDESFILIRREIQQNGQNRIFINDSLVSKFELENIAEKLIDFHGQHAHQSLLKKEKHIYFLDLFLDDTKKKKEYQKEFNSLRSLLENYHSLQKSYQEKIETYNKSKQIITEIDGFEISIEDEDALKEEEQRLLDSDQIISSITRSEQLISETEFSLSEQLKTLLNEINYLKKYDAGLENFLVEFENFRSTLNESSFSIQNLKSKTDMNPQRLEFVQSRLYEYEKLKRKYGNTVDDILEYKNKLETEIEDLGQLKSKIETLELEIKDKIRKIKILGTELSNLREKAAVAIKNSIKLIFNRLDMQNAEIDFHIEAVNATLRFQNEELPFTENGFESVELKIKTNKGSEFLPIEKIASGGELSRVMLALKSYMADRDSLPLLIFDEIDSGVSGKIAEAVAKEIKKLSAYHQIICITHTAQLSSKGSQHYKVWKEEFTDNVETKIKRLSHGERVKEIAEMISDGNSSDHSVNLAKELLAANG